MIGEDWVQSTGWLRTPETCSTVGPCPLQPGLKSFAGILNCSSAEIPLSCACRCTRCCNFTPPFGSIQHFPVVTPDVSPFCPGLGRNGLAGSCYRCLLRHLQEVCQPCTCAVHLWHCPFLRSFAPYSSSHFPLASLFPIRRNTSD